MMKIDVFPHILPTKFMEAVNRIAGDKYYNKQVNEAIPTIYDLDIRFRVLDKFDNMVQVLTLGAPPLETIGEPKQTVELARIANDGMAELVTKYPDRFVAGVASLPMNDMDAALKEADRAINDLKLRGVQIYTPTNGKPIDQPEFLPLYEKMASYNLPIWIHPVRERTVADYVGESGSKYFIWGIFGWPYETTAAMTRLIFSGVLERYPNLKFITHHCGGMIPFFEQRLAIAYDMNEMRLGAKVKQRLTKPVIEYYRMFYADTAVHSKIAIRCGYEFFGPEHILFGTDMPYDNELGFRFVRQGVEAIEQMDIPDTEKKKIFADNARKLLRLPI
jgi:predicted TIM-barrel fold metal-dependent hydrolase